MKRRYISVSDVTYKRLDATARRRRVTMATRIGMAAARRRAHAAPRQRGPMRTLAISARIAALVESRVAGTGLHRRKTLERAIHAVLDSVGAVQ